VKKIDYWLMLVKSTLSVVAEMMAEENAAHSTSM
jgi:hypothetical protein